MSLDKYAGLFASSAKSMADSARSIEMFAEVLESQMETQNALLSTISDKLDRAGNTSKSSGSAAGSDKGSNKVGSVISGMSNDLGSAADNMKSFTEAAPGFVKALFSFTGAIKKFEGIEDGTIKNFTDGLKLISDRLSDIDFRSIKEGGDAMMSMSKSIAVFGFTIAVASIAYLLIGPIAAVTIIPVIAGFAFVFNLIGKAAPEIEAGAKAIGWMSIAIVGMAAALALTMLLGGGSWGAFMSGVGMVVLGLATFGLVFHIIGSLENQIEKGAGAVFWMGLAIISLAAGMGIWSLFNITITDVLVTAAAVALIGGAFALIGFLGGPLIVTAATGILIAGLSLVSLAFGLGAFRLFGIDMESVGVAGAAVAFVGGAFALVGLVAPLVFAAGIALSFAGISIMLLAGGLAVMDKVYAKAQDGLLAPSILNPRVTNLEQIVSSVARAFSINLVDSVLMIVGAAAVTIASVAMLTLSAGIWALSKHAFSPLFNPEQGLYPGSSGMTTKLDNMISSIVSSFSINPIRSVMMIVGAAALLVASVAMITLSAGLWALGKQADNSLFQVEGASYADGPAQTTRLDNVVTGIVNAFSINPLKSVAMIVGSAALMTSSIAMMLMSGGIVLMGKAYDKSQSLFRTSEHDSNNTNIGLVFDSIKNAMILGPLEMISLYASVPAWMMVGSSIKNIGQGIADFVKIYEKGVDPGKLAGALKTVLTSVVNSIIDAGPNGSTIDWDDVEDGLDAIDGVGSIISGIADGIQKFADLKFPVYGPDGKIKSYLTLNDGVFTRVAANMKLMIGAVANTLTEIGEKQGEVGWFSKSKGEMGADVIKGIGGDLTGIADFVLKAADLRIPVYDANGKLIEGQTRELTPAMLGPGGIVSNNIKMMITSMADALMKIGSNEAESEGWFSPGNITKGKEAIMGIGKDINDIAQAALAFSQIENMDAVKMKLKQAVLFIPDILIGSDGNGGLYALIEGNRDKLFGVLAVLNAANQPFNKALEMIENLGSSSADPNKATDIGSSIAKLFQEIIKSTTGPGLQVGKLGPINDFVSSLAEHADPIDKLADAFDKLSGGMNKFVKAYKGMDKGSMERHKLLVDSLVVFSKADPSKLDALSDRGVQLLDYINSGGPKKAETTAVTPAPSRPEQKGTTSIAGTKTEKQPTVTQQNIDIQPLLQELQSTRQELAMIKNILGGTIKVRESI